MANRVLDQAEPVPGRGPGAAAGARGDLVIEGGPGPRLLRSRDGRFRSARRRPDPRRAGARWVRRARPATASRSRPTSSRGCPPSCGWASGSSATPTACPRSSRRGEEAARLRRADRDRGQCRGGALASAACAPTRSSATGSSPSAAASADQGMRSLPAGSRPGRAQIGSRPFASRRTSRLFSQALRSTSLSSGINGAPAPPAPIGAGRLRADAVLDTDTDPPLEPARVADHVLDPPARSRGRRVRRRSLQGPQLIGRAPHLLLDLGQPLGRQLSSGPPAELGQRERPDPCALERVDRRIAVLSDDPGVNVARMHPELDGQQLAKPPRVERCN